MESRELRRLASVIALLLFLQSSGCQNMTSCKLGDCIGVLLCPVLRPAISLITLSKSSDVKALVRQHRCDGSEDKSICCADLEADLVKNFDFSNLTDERSIAVLANLIRGPCGYSSGSDRIMNGDTAFLFEFPWMSMLEFSNSTGFKSFLCAGSLINDQYVLTAAHCFIGRGLQLTNVRLGEFNTSSEIDCENFGMQNVCLPPAQDYQVDEVIIHEDFKSGLFLNDIALIRLKNKVTYGDRILPICLPFLKDTQTNFTFAEVAGWGLTSSGRTADVLQKAFLPLISKKDCEKLFLRTFYSHICAGGVIGRDTCQGDSGGPLFQRSRRNAHRFVQYGILSAGGVVCGGNNTTPSIYTSVVDFVPWIVSKIRL